MDTSRPDRRTSSRTSLTGLLVAVLALMSLTTVAPGQCEPSVIGRLDRTAFAGNLQSVYIDDTTAYAAYSQALVILDITDPTEPSVLDKLLIPEGNFSIVGLAANTLFLQSADRIDLYDVTDPQALDFASTIPFPAGTVSVKVGGVMVYFATETGLLIYDASDRMNPTLAGSMSTWIPVTLYDVTDTGIVHMASKFGEFEVVRRVFVDVSNPSSPTIVLNNPPMRSDAIFDGSFAYEGYEAAGVTAFGLRVYDLTNPAAPVLVGSVQLPPVDSGSSPELFFRLGDRQFYFTYTVYDYLECGGGKYCFFGRTYRARVDVSDPANMTYEGPIFQDDGVRLPTFLAYKGTIAVGKTLTRGWFQIYDLTELVNPILIGEYLETNPADRPVFVGDDAFAINRHQLVRLNLENPGQPTLVDQPPLPLNFVRVETITSGAEAGDYVFIAGALFEQGFPLESMIVDVSDPASPTIVFRHTLQDWTSDWSFLTVVPFESFVAVTGGPLGTALLDVSDPANPAVISTIPDTRPVGRSGPLLVVNQVSGPSFSGFAMYDVSDPNNPTIVGQSEPEFGPVSVVEGSLAFRIMASQFPPALADIQCISLENPAQPVLVGVIPSSATTDPGTLVAFGSLVTMTEDLYAVMAYDFSDPSAPRALGAAYTAGTVYDDRSFGPDGTLYILEDFSDLLAIDIMSPGQVGLLGSAPASDSAFGVSTAGDLAFVSDYFGGVRIFDISDPADPIEVGAYDTPDRAYETVVVGNLAYVADGATGLVVLDVSDPTSPTLVGSLALSDLAIGLAVEGDFAYLATRFDGLQILDITNPASPVLVGSVDTPGSAQQVTLDGNLVYVADGTGGVQVIDVTARSSPTIIGSYNTPASARQVLVRGLVAYVPDRTTGLLALDISDPTNPQLISTLPGLGDTRGVTAWGHLAFVVDFAGFVHMVDIADPGDMQLVQSVASLGTPRAVSNDGRMLYLADGDSGLTILDAQPCWYNPCPADLIEDGLLDFFDIQAYLNAYSASDGLADWNDDGQIDFFDLQRYLIDYSAGCP
jgi:hypothetical protein